MPNHFRKKFFRIPRTSDAAPLRLATLAVSLFRHVVLGLLGSFFISRGLVEEDAWKTVSGILMTLTTYALSWWSDCKLASPETFRARLLGLVRHVISSLAGISLALGWIGPDLVDAIAAALAGVAASLLSARAPEKIYPADLIPSDRDDDDDDIDYPGRFMPGPLLLLLSPLFLLASCSSMPQMEEIRERTEFGVGVASENGWWYGPVKFRYIQVTETVPPATK